MPQQPLSALLSGRYADLTGGKESMDRSRVGFGAFAPVLLCARCFERHKAGACDRAHERGPTPPFQDDYCGDQAWHDAQGEARDASYGELPGLCRPRMD